MQTDAGVCETQILPHLALEPLGRVWLVFEAGPG
jgi:hypothetical protein